LQPLQFVLFSYALLHYFAHDLHVFSNCDQFHYFYFKKTTKQIPQNQRLFMFCCFFFFSDFVFHQLAKVGHQKNTDEHFTKVSPHHWLSLTRGLGEYKKANCQS
jgi:hypothetical protein